jgi:hypothetical protein
MTVCIIQTNYCAVGSYFASLAQGKYAARASATFTQRNWLGSASLSVSSFGLTILKGPEKAIDHLITRAA